MIGTVLIANRGEIACRVIRTCRRLGIRVVAVYSDVDANSLHVRMADEAIWIGPAPASSSYLNMDAVLGAATRSEADAIHPGFGFLSENADFARATLATGLTWIGPSPEAMDSMGNKSAARQLVAQRGVPTVPGYDGGDQTDGRLVEEAQRIGFPLMVKAAAGGGGKGMRLVARAEDLEEALAAARRESLQAFGSDQLLLERAIIEPRHIEFQVFGDNTGQIIHLGERECSVQRRHQKVIEETPSVALDSRLREAMGRAAVKAAGSVNYTNAGTVEFLLDKQNDYYFLEMNTRLQVEHPVTELVTGLDLVEWQICVAEGQPLPLRQEEVRFRGHAVEARLYAENPSNQFLPVTGTIVCWHSPEGEGIRVESGISSGDEISIYYDPMLAKIIGYGRDRADANRRLSRALEETVLLGLTSNRGYLHAILRQQAYQRGELSTDFLARYLSGWHEQEGDLVLALVAATVRQWESLTASGSPEISGYWRNNPNSPTRYRYNDGSDRPLEVLLTSANRGEGYHLSIEGRELDVRLNEIQEHTMTLTLFGYRQTVWLAQQGSQWWVQTRKGGVQLKSLSLLPEPRSVADAGGSLRAPMPGSVIQILVKQGQQVQKGDPLLKLEAMKMEHTIRTSADGIVEAIYYREGETVPADALLVKIREE